MSTKKGARLSHRNDDKPNPSSLSRRRGTGMKAQNNMTSPFGQCVICHNNRTSALVSLQEEQKDTFVRFVKHFHFQPHFSTILGGNRTNPRSTGVGKACCQDCADVVKTVWELNAAIETVQRQIRNTISNLVNAKGKDAGSHVTKHKASPSRKTPVELSGDEEKIEFHVKMELNVSDDDDHSEMDAFVPTAYQSSEFEDGIGISPGRSSTRVDDNNPVRRSLRQNSGKRKLDNDVVHDQGDDEDDDDFQLDSDSEVSEPNSRSSSNHDKLKDMKKIVLDNKCKECGVPFTSLKSLKQHLQDVHKHQNPTPFSCPHCDRCLSTPASLKAHLRFMHRDKLPKDEMKELRCTICGKDFPFISYRMAHEINWCKIVYDDERLKKAKVKLFRCAQVGCGLVFAKSSYFNRHVKSSHSNRTAKNIKVNETTANHRVSTTCSVCGKKFERLRIRLVHEFNVCGVPYDEDKLKQELKGSKSTVKLAKCTYPGCEMVCYGALLQRHLCTHTGELPYQCQYCGKAFSQDSTRKHHELSVCAPDPSIVADVIRRQAASRERQKLNTVPCPHEDCKKKFLNATTLNVHLKAFHGTMDAKGGGGEPSSMCDICGNAFPCDTSLRIHVRRAHEAPTTNFPCLLRSSSGCEDRFNSFEERRRHMTDVHGRIKKRSHTSKRK